MHAGPGRGCPAWDPAVGREGGPRSEVDALWNHLPGMQSLPTQLCFATNCCATPRMHVTCPCACKPAQNSPGAVHMNNSAGRLGR